MNGAVFEIHAEQPPKGQFQDTLDVLKIYSSTMHKLDIDSLNVLFIDITEPTIVTPTEPIAQEISLFLMKYPHKELVYDQCFCVLFSYIS